MQVLLESIDFDMKHCFVKFRHASRLHLHDLLQMYSLYAGLSLLAPLFSASVTINTPLGSSRVLIALDTCVVQ